MYHKIFHTQRLQLLLIGLILATCMSSSAQTPAAELKPIERFDGRIQLRIRNERITVRVVIENWMFHGGQEIDNFQMPVKGFLIVQLRGGKLFTMINRERRKRREDELWTVSTGA